MELSGKDVCRLTLWLLARVLYGTCVPADIGGRHLRAVGNPDFRAILAYRVRSSNGLAMLGTRGSAGLALLPEPKGRCNLRNRTQPAWGGIVNHADAGGGPGSHSVRRRPRSTTLTNVERDGRATLQVIGRDNILALIAGHARACRTRSRARQCHVA